MQQQLSLTSGTLLGRKSPGSGSAEVIAIGANLSLNGGTLVAASSPFTVSQLPSGAVPSIADQIAISQSGTNVAITYSQFQNSLSSVPNINLSQALVTPTGSTSSRKLADFASSVLSVNGGTLTGPLQLAGAPTAALQAATKAYADLIGLGALSVSGGSLSGPLILGGDPTVSSQAATKNYVDGQVSNALAKSGGSVSGALTLAGDPTANLQAATKQYVDGKVARSGDTLTGPLLLAGSPSVPLQAASKSYVDIQLQTALPAAGGTLAGSLILAGDPTAGTQAATKNYVDTQVSTSVLRTGGTISGAIVLSADPVVPLQAATKQYVDTRILRSGDTLTGQLFLAADPSTPSQAATKSYVDGQMATALPRTGGSLTGALALSADPVTTSHAATKRYVDAQVATSVPIAGGTLAGALMLAAAPVTSASLVNKQYVDGQVATVLPLAGGTLTGGLTLAAGPTANLHASTKQYVDSSAGLPGVIEVKSAAYSAQINGTTDDTAAFATAYQAAPSGGRIHVPSGITVLKSPSAWNVPLTKPVKWLVDGTTLPDGTSLSSAIPAGGNPATLSLPGIVEGYSASGSEFSRSGSSTNDFAVLHAAYIVNHTGGNSSVIANERSDTIIYNSPNNYVWSGLDRLVWAGIQTPNSTAAAQHVGRYVQTIRQSIGTNSSGAPLPQPQLWAACLEYRDATGKPSSWANASLTIEMDWIGNGPDDGNSRQIQSLVVAQNDPSGTPVEISTVVGVYLAGGSTGHAYRVFNVGIPFSIAVLDTTSSQQLAGAAAIRMAAGHSIAFEPTASNVLTYDSPTGTLRWKQGTLSYIVGKGLTVGWANVCGSNTSLPGYLAGNIVLLVGSSPYTVSLPTAASTPAGTGFTFSMLGTTSVTITPNGSDGIDNGPVVLRNSDRYHIVSDGTSYWREVFRTNSVSPRFTGPPVLPTYAVSTLPASPGTGAKAFATNGRKPNEGTGAGSGVEVFYDGSRWISGCTGSQVVA
ncbi:MAG: hypothetical protein P4L71_08540 [Acetobacteraceae bacterium]|nr:hypothetical protein [Acetobacteraceae bacterium]